MEVADPFVLAAVKDECLDTISRLEKEAHDRELANQEKIENITYGRKAEYDRELANTESQENIKYGRKGYRISIVAIILSGIAISIELAKWIWQLLR